MKRIKTIREEMTAEEKADLDAMFERIYAEALANGADPKNIEEFKQFREEHENLATYAWPGEENEDDVLRP